MAEQMIPTAMGSNPLANYFRQPKIYIKLPSEGRFYPAGSLDVSQNGEYAVYAMTAKDELMFKTPDALMNGQATVEVIKSCIPAIKDPWKMPSIDVDAVLLAIRIATYGEKMDVSARCPSCNHENEYSINLVGFIENRAHFHYDEVIDLQPLTIFVRPYSYHESTKTAIKSLEQQKIFEIVNDEKLSDEDKIEKFGKSFVKLTELTVDIIAGCVWKIVTPDSETEDPKFIKEFITNAPKNVFDKINEHVTNIKKEIELKIEGTKCENCEHEFTMPITMDQTNFFGTGS